MSNFETVQFHGQELIALKEDNRILVPIKRICENIGLEWSAQRKLIKNDEVLKKGMVVCAIPSAGGVQQMSCLPLELIPGWLFLIPAARYSGERYDTITLYRKECFKALSDHFLKRDDSIDINKLTNQFCKMMETVTSFMQATEKRFEDLEKMVKAQSEKRQQNIQWRYTASPSDPYVQINDDLYALLKESINRAGSRSMWCQTTGISRSMLSEYLLGKTKSVKPETFKKMWSAIGDIIAD